MKNLFKLTLAVIFISVGSGCEKVEDPTACFSPSATSVAVNSAVAFTNCSENAESYEWNFGDGSTATGSAASHIYTAPGTYSVVLTAFGEEKDAQTTQSITVTGDDPNTEACVQNNFGFVRVSNSYDSNYSVYINNTYKGTVSGYGTSAAFQYSGGSSVSVRILQLDGYILYPSEFTGYGVIVQCQTITVSPS